MNNNKFNFIRKIGKQHHKKYATKMYATTCIFADMYSCNYRIIVFTKNHIISYTLTMLHHRTKRLKLC